MQLGEESLAVSSIAEPAPRVVERPFVFPTIGVAVTGETAVSGAASVRTSGEQLPVESFEPLSAETLSQLEVALANQPFANQPVETFEEQIRPRSHVTIWVLLGIAVGLAGATALMVVRRRHAGRR